MRAFCLLLPLSYDVCTPIPCGTRRWSSGFSSTSWRVIPSGADYTGTWPSYLTDLLSLRLVRVVRARINVRSSYLQRGPAVAWIQTKVFTVVSPVLYHWAIPLSPDAGQGTCGVNAYSWHWAIPLSCLLRNCFTAVDMKREGFTLTLVKWWCL